jgi:hypothetical protein
MTAAPPFAFPGSRSLAGWWRQLAPYHPRSWWVAHLLLHRVEAPVRVTRTMVPDPFALWMLDALQCHAGATPEKLNLSLPLGVPVIRQVLRQLKKDNLVEADAANTWKPTPLGHEARLQRKYACPAYQRRKFYFHHDETASPLFMNLTNPPTVPWPAGEAWQFDWNRLQECIARPIEWKRDHGFPPDIEEVIADSDGSFAGGSNPEIGRRGIGCQPEYLSVVLLKAKTASRNDHLLGFGFNPTEWTLNVTKPVLDWPLSKLDSFSELIPQPATEQWREVWTEWGKENGLSDAELADSTLEPRDFRLRVFAPRSVLDKLRAMRNEVLRGEVWLLTRSDRIRAAGLLDIGTREEKKGK